MKNLFTLLLITVSLLPLAAQDYAPFRMGYTPYFQAGDSVYSLRITSVQVQGGDSVFEFNPIAVENASAQVASCNGQTQLQPGSYLKTLNNIFGHKMIKNSNNDYLFEFSPSETFLLRPSAQINESWWFSQQLQLNATMIGRGLGQVNGVSDSVATISLSNGDEILVSKTYGLFNSKSFKSYLQTLSINSPLQLIAQEGTNLGQPVSKPSLIYDFQAGDKFLFQISQDGGNLMAPCYSGLETLEVLGRTDYPGGDSIIYQLRKQRLTTNTGNCNGFIAGSFLSSFDTTSFHVTQLNYGFLNSLHQEYTSFAIDSSFGMRYGAFNTGQFISDFNNRIGAEYQMKVLDTCAGYYSNPMLPGSYHHQKFAAGLGQVYYNYFNYYMGDGIDYKSTLIAYIKGPETYGNWQPLVLSREAKIDKQQLQLYPNPFTSEFTLQLPEADAVSEAAEVTIYNLQGQQVFRQKVSSLASQTGVNLQLGHLPTGLYLLHLQQGEKSYSAKVQRQ